MAQNRRTNAVQAIALRTIWGRTCRCSQSDFACGTMPCSDFVGWHVFCCV